MVVACGPQALSPNEEEEYKKRPLDSETKKKLFEAIDNNNIEKVKTFFDIYKGVVNARDEDKMTPFLHAAKEGLPEILRLLLKKGADVSATDKNGNNALHEACRMGHFETANWLLNNCKTKLDLEARGSFGRTPFLLAAQKGHLDILKLLKENGANASVTDKNGHNALHFACMMGKTETVNWLLKKCNINLEAKDNWYKRTPFLLAAEKGHLEILKALKAYGASVSATEKYGENALYSASKIGHFETVNWLLKECNISLEDKDDSGKMTPFLIAAKKGHLDILKLLKAYEADVNATDKDGDNALQLAWMANHFETVRWLLNNCKINLEAKNKRYKRTLFLLAAEKGHLDILKLLEEKRANIYATDRCGNNALHLACIMDRNRDSQMAS